MTYLLLIPIGYLVLGLILYFRQDGMIFFPSRTPDDELLREADVQGFEPWRNADGLQIGWQSREGDPHNALLVFHGNGGQALYLTFYRDLARRAPGNWKTFLLEYPGYGHRDGTPSETTLTAAGVEAVDTLAGVPDRKIWLVGVSLGSGAAAATVRERPDRIAGLVMVTPFDSLVGAAAFHYPWLPVSLFLKTRFESGKNLASYPGPVAFLLSAHDTTTPFVLGKKLFDGYGGRKRLWVDAGGDHDVSPLQDAEWPQIVEWLQGGTN